MDLKKELIGLALLLLIAGLVFANSLSGEFVYDDARQIVRNPLIQESALYGKALTSDVWAFRGDGTIVTSNYWRPTFVTWLIFNFRVFKANPLGWHLLSILLHLGVCALAYCLLWRWNLSAKLAFAVTLIFAVHPVHAESVSWISGSPDLLFAFAFLGSLLCADRVSARDGEERRNVLYFSLSLIFYAIALGAKEAGILCFPVYWLVFKRQESESPAKKTPFSAAGDSRFLVYPAIAAAYFVLRWLVIGRIALPREDAVSLGSTVLTLPAIFVFYIKQMIFPLWLGTNYSLRPVTELNFTKFFLPLIVSVLAVAALWLAARRSSVQKIGFWLFILPLLPAMNASAFPPEQIVHDRYLYLPLLGFLLVIMPYFKSVIEKFIPEKSAFVPLAAAALIAAPLGWQTFHYNRTWLNDLSIWENAVRIDPASSYNWSQYGVFLSEQGRASEAAAAFDKALSIRPTPIAYLGQARNFLEQKKYEAAVSNLLMLTEKTAGEINPYVLYQAYETLAIIYLDQSKFDDAIKSLEEGRKRLPIYHAALTEKLAVVLYNAGRKESALKELEQARNQSRTELLPESKTVLLRLGMLYAEQNRKEDAKDALEEYLRLTASIRDKLTIANRSQASRLLKALN